MLKYCLNRIVESMRLESIHLSLNGQLGLMLLDVGSEFRDQRERLGFSIDVTVQGEYKTSGVRHTINGKTSLIDSNTSLDQKLFELHETLSCLESKVPLLLDQSLMQKPSKSFPKAHLH